MAVYTHLGAEQLADLIARYDVGDLMSAKGIAEGVSNSNWVIETTRGRYILTLYERRIDPDELPFFLGLLDHLAAEGCAVPAAIHDREGRALQRVEGKAAALMEFLPGVSPGRPTAAQARAVGEALARVHLAGRNFAQTRENPLRPSANLSTLESIGPNRLAAIDPGLPQAIENARGLVAELPSGLPQSIIHSDLFPDNVLMLGNRVSGIIDFYFACSDAMAYDIAVTHAAWSFDKQGNAYSPEIGTEMVRGYESVRTLEEREREALPTMAQCACLRFLTSRTEDWLETPPDALVERKDPLDFVRRWEFYAENGSEVFA